MENREYNVYKGLQKPIVLFGLKGSNIAWAAGTIAAVAIVFILASSMTGTVPSILAALVPAAVGGYKINYKAKNGLHEKKRHKGVILVRKTISPLVK